MIFGVNKVGEVGIVKDTAAHELPPAAWSDGKNVRFVDAAAEAVKGYTPLIASPVVAPYAFMSAPSGNNYFGLYFGLNKVYAFDGAIHSNITRQTLGVDVDYTGVATDLWTGGVLGGLPIFNNGVDVPQVWALAGRAENLPNWPSTVRAKVFRIYKQFVIALNLVKGGTQYPFTIKWSHPADPGSVPISWDETDPTKDTGEYTFSEGGDWVVDCATLGDTVVVYKENSVWSMQYIGGVDIFRFSKLFGTFGALGVNCAVEFARGQHCVITRGDVVVHDGQRMQSILSAKMKAWLFSTLNQTALHNCFIAANAELEEVWICYPRDANTEASDVIIWNWSTGALGHKELPRITSLQTETAKFVETTSVSWAGDTQTWEDDATAWSERTYKIAAPSFVFTAPAQNAVYTTYTGMTNNGDAQETYLERTGIGLPLKQGVPPDFTSMKFIQNVWPRLDGTAGGIVWVEVGVQNEIAGPVTWGAKQIFVIGTTKKIDVFMSGRLLALRFSSNTAIRWRLLGYEVDVAFGGNF